MTLLRRFVDKDELYPLYILRLPAQSWPGAVSALLPEDVVKRYERAMKAFNASQDELEDIYEKGGGDFANDA